MNYRLHKQLMRQLIYATIIVSLCAESVYAEQILNLPRAVRDSCAIVRGHPVFLGESLFYDKQAGYEVERNAVWSINITEVYRWKLPGWSVEGELGSPGHKTPRQFIDVPQRLIYVMPGMSAIRKYKREVFIFLECGCNGEYIFTQIGWPLYITEDKSKGVKRKSINGWSITGFPDKKVSLEDFAMAIKTEEKKPTNNPNESLAPTFMMID